MQQAYQAAAGSTDSVPATQNTVALGAAPGGAAGAPGADGPFGISYQFQTTGLTKYAPMQPKPGTKITARNTAPLFAASPFTVATTFLPLPSQVTTITQAVTYSASSRENTVCFPDSFYIYADSCLQGFAGTNANGQHAEIPSSMERLIAFLKWSFYTQHRWVLLSCIGIRRILTWGEAIMTKDWSGIGRS